MRRAALIALAAGALLAACGNGSGEPGVVVAGGDRREPVRDREPRRAADADRALRLARLRDLAAGDRRACSSSSRPGRIRVLRGGKQLRTVPRHPLAGHVGRRAGPAVDRLRARLRELGPLLRLLHRHVQDQRVVEYKRASADRADPGSARLVLRMDDPEANHNGGLLLFGPDKHLYIGTGDGGGAGDQHGARGNAQNLGTLLGKILRIDPRSRAASPTRPLRQPVREPRRRARREIYSYGLRNPWRYSFDRKTGDLAIGDVGQDAVEEIDFVRRGKGKGANFGWRAFEGRSRSSPARARPALSSP